MRAASERGRRPISRTAVGNYARKERSDPEKHNASFVDDGGPPRHPVNIGMLVEDLRDRNEGSRFVTVVGIDPGHRIRIAAGRKTAIDRIIESAIGLARKRKL
jgi:hypothetical protein